jgi:hypothetical protein
VEYNGGAGGQLFIKVAKFLGANSNVRIKQREL